MWRSCVIVMLVAVFDAPTARGGDTRPPNLVVVLVDDLGYGDLSSYGAPDLRTPNVDGLIASGMRFDNFYANSPVCSPTRASLLAGRYPELLGVPGVIRTHAENSWGFLNPQATLLPEALAAAGYESAIVGKWHLGLESPNTPLERGFDFFHGFLGDMMDDYYHHRRHDRNYMRRNHEQIDPEGHATDLFADWACQFLERRAPSDPPFFLYLAFNAPHTPIQPPADWLARVQQREAGISENRARLVALVEHLDAAVGRVLATLADRGLADDTVVVFTSDNGGQLDVAARNGPWRDGKQSMYEGGLRVPAGVAWPGHIQAGSRSTRLALTMDLFPTLCELAGAEAPAAIDGRSFAPTLLGHDQPDADREVYFHRREGGERYGGLTIQAVRRGDWKLLQNSPFGPLELYNLADDPAERHDRAHANRREFLELQRLLQRQQQRAGAVPWQRAGE